MPINRYKKSFSSYLKLERALSKNSIEAYLYDLELLNAYLRKKNKCKINTKYKREYTQKIYPLDQ